MSMENAILEHAGALKELAAAIRSMGATVALSSTVDQRDTLLQDKAADLAAATEQRAAAAREALKKDQEAEAAETKDNQAGPTGADKTSEVVKAVSAEIEGKGTVVPDAEQEHGCAYGAAALKEQTAPLLDYAKDVRPVLLAAIKKAGKDTVAAMLKTFGVDKADQLNAEQLPAALAKAQALAA